MTLPRIIVIDDQYGGIPDNGRNRLRENFCRRAGLQDITGDGKAERIEDPVAEAVFHRGQVLQGGVAYNDPEGILLAIREGWRQAPRWSLLLLDLHFNTGRIGPDGAAEGKARDREPEHYFGLQVLDKLWHDPELLEIPIVVLSSMRREEVERRLSSDSYSVNEFIDKTQLNRARLTQALFEHGLIADDRIIGHSHALLKSLRETRGRARIGDDNILILGESGTGKELFARYAHDKSPRAQKPYVVVDAQLVPETLVEDWLFGHEKNSFYGATDASPGAAEKADGGTLFIDEFGNLPVSVQPKLLRLLDKNIRESQRIGARKAKTLDLQIVVATNRFDLVSANDFRHDLLYRVKADDPIILPPLRERVDDIPLLVSHFVRKYEAKVPGAVKRAIDPKVIEQLCAHSWPGNVRELEWVIEKAIKQYSTFRILSPAHLSMGAGSSGSLTRISAPLGINESKLRTASDDKEPSQEIHAANSGLTEPAKLDASSEVEAGTHHGKDHHLFSDIIDHLQSLEFETAPEKRGDLAEALPRLNSAYSQCVAKILRTSLIATSKSTPEQPEGEIQITPAVNLLLGENKSTSACADEIKRLFRQSPKSVQQDWQADSVLQEALNKALALRPKK